MYTETQEEYAMEVEKMDRDRLLFELGLAERLYALLSTLPRDEFYYRETHKVLKSKELLTKRLTVTKKRKKI